MYNSNNNNNQNTNPPIIIKGGGNGALYVVLGVLTVGGFIVGKKMYDSYRLKQENKKAGEDNSTNLASQIHAENRATWTEDSVQINLYRQITDYKKTQQAYLRVSSGKDMLEDTRKHVSSGSYQTILNILGIQGGAIQATSQTAIDVKNNLSQFSWVVAKVDARIRKSPKAGSAIFTLRSNIIGVAKGNTIIGIIDKMTLLKNKSKLFYDDTNSTFFLPILVFNAKNPRKLYNAFVAIVNVNVYKDQPKNLDYFSISEFQYEHAYSVSGLESF